MATATTDVTNEKSLEFLDYFADELGEDLQGDYDGAGTYTFDAEHFFLSFSIDDSGRFVIQNLKCRTEGIGIGKRVVQAIHSFADEYDMSVVARKVTDGRQGFWKNMGYEEGTGDEFFRAQ